MTEGVIEDELAEEVMQKETPGLAGIAASDPALRVRTSEAGEVEASVVLSDALFGFGFGIGDASLSPDTLAARLNTAAPRRSYFRSKRSSSITLTQAATKSFANFAFASSCA